MSTAASPAGAGTPDSPVKTLEQQHVLQTYRRVPVVFTRGDGVYLFDDKGRRYLDLISGIGVASLGHANPTLAAAIAEQAETLLHTSNLYFHELQGQVAARLTALAGLDRAFLCNSGTEAIEGCLKFARRFWHTAGNHERSGFVAFEHAFHGRTMGALSVTWDDHYRAPFEPLLGPVTWIPSDHPDALEAAVTSKTAAIIVEAIQGEGGVRPISERMAAAIKRVQQRTGVLLIADEVQCGLGRTGVSFGFQRFGLEPDLVAVGKALGGGVPVGSVLLTQRIADAISFGDHGTTYGGNLLACRAAIVFLDALAGGLQEHVRQMGLRFGGGLRALAAAHPVIKDVRGAGLMWGLDLGVNVTPYIDAALKRGLLINRTADTVIRMLPPYVISAAEVDSALTLLGQVFSDVRPEGA